MAEQTQTTGMEISADRVDWRGQVMAALNGIQAPLLAIVGAILIGALIMLLTGHNPVEAYVAMFEGAFTGRNLVSTINRSAPIVGMGIAAAVAFRAGFFNIGVEGQLVLGGVVSAIVATSINAPPVVMFPLIFLSAMLAAGLYALLPTWVDFKLGVPLLVSTLLLNYPARFFASWLIAEPFQDVASGMNQTFQVPEALRLPQLFDTRLHAGLFITLALVLAAAFIMRRTVTGYHIRMNGLNSRFTQYGGVNVNRLGYLVMFSSGAIAGLVGSLETLGVLYRYTDGGLLSPLYAWVGLMAALLAGSAPLGVLIAGTFFSIIQTGGLGMERDTEIARELSNVLQAVIIMLVAIRASFEFNLFGRKQSEPEAAAEETG